MTIEQPITPTISVVVPCYNQAEYIPSLLLSVARACKYPHEVIVVDDGSTSGSTRRILGNLLAASESQRVLVVHQDNRGLSSARNRGLSQATGEAVVFLDGDDLLLPDGLSELYACLEDESLDVCVGDFLFCNQDRNRFWAPEPGILSELNFSFYGVARFWERGFSIPIHAALFRRTFLDDAPFTSQLRAKEDWLFWMAFFRKEPKARHLRVESAVYRLHEASMTRDGRRMAVAWIDALQLAARQTPVFSRYLKEEALTHLKDFYYPYFWSAQGLKFPVSFFNDYLALDKVRGK